MPGDKVKVVDVVFKSGTEAMELSYPSDAYNALVEEEIKINRKFAYANPSILLPPVSTWKYQRISFPLTTAYFSPLREGMIINALHPREPNMKEIDWKSDSITGTLTFKSTADRYAVLPRHRYAIPITRTKNPSEYSITINPPKEGSQRPTHIRTYVTIAKVILVNKNGTVTVGYTKSIKVRRRAYIRGHGLVTIEPKEFNERNKPNGVSKSFGQFKIHPRLGDVMTWDVKENMPIHLSSKAPIRVSKVIKDEQGMIKIKVTPEEIETTRILFPVYKKSAYRSTPTSMTVIDPSDNKMKITGTNKDFIVDNDNVYINKEDVEENTGEPSESAISAITLWTRNSSEIDTLSVHQDFKQAWRVLPDAFVGNVLQNMLTCATIRACKTRKFKKLSDVENWQDKASWTMDLTDRAMFPFWKCQDFYVVGIQHNDDERKMCTRSEYAFPWNLTEAEGIMLFMVQKADTKKEDRVVAEVTSEVTSIVWEKVLGVPTPSIDSVKQLTEIKFVYVATSEYKRQQKVIVLTIQIDKEMRYFKHTYEHRRSSSGQRNNISIKQYEALNILNGGDDIIVLWKIEKEIYTERMVNTKILHDMKKIRDMIHRRNKPLLPVLSGNPVLTLPYVFLEERAEPDFFAQIGTRALKIIADNNISDQYDDTKITWPPVENDNMNKLIPDNVLKKEVAFNDEDSMKIKSAVIRELPPYQLPTSIMSDGARRIKREQLIECMDKFESKDQQDTLSDQQDKEPPPIIAYLRSIENTFNGDDDNSQGQHDSMRLAVSLALIHAIIDESMHTIDVTESFLKVYVDMLALRLSDEDEVQSDLELHEELLRPSAEDEVDEELLRPSEVQSDSDNMDNWEEELDEKSDVKLESLVNEYKKLKEIPAVDASVSDAFKDFDFFQQ